MSSDVLLEVEDLRKSFGRTNVLQGVNLRLARGEVLGLIGPNGSGKTTLINVVSGVYGADGGAVRLDGRDVTGTRSNRMSRLGVNRTFQVPKPFASLTARENIEVAAIFGRRRAVERARLNDILEFVGLQDVAEREARSLNTAQQKFLDLARALASDPELLLIDELGAGLGPADLASVAAKLSEINALGVTLLVVEHLMGFLGQLTRRVVVMNAGAEIFTGDLEAASQDPTVAEVFLGR